MPELSRSTWNYILALVLAVASAGFVRTSLLEAFRMPSEVMRPTLIPGDLIFVWKPSLGFKFPFLGRSKTSAPSYGSVVVYAPQDMSRAYYVKRVVGLPGDKVGVQNGKLVFRGLVLEGPENGCGIEKNPEGEYEICLGAQALKDQEPLTVPDGHAFVISDHRQHRMANRTYDLVPFRDLVGEARWIWFSVVPGSDPPSVRWGRVFRSI